MISLVLGVPKGEVSKDAENLKKNILDTYPSIARKIIDSSLIAAMDRVPNLSKADFSEEIQGLINEKPKEESITDNFEKAMRASTIKRIEQVQKFLQRLRSLDLNNRGLRKPLKKALEELGDE